APPAHRRNDLPRRKEETERIDPPRPLEVFRRHVLDRAPDAGAGVEDEDVDVAEFGPRALERACNRRRVGDIAGMGLGARELAGEPRGEVGAPRHQRDRVAVGGKAPGKSFAIARADADDGADGCLVVRHCSILPKDVCDPHDPATGEPRAQRVPRRRRDRLDGSPQAAPSGAPHDGAPNPPETREQREREKPMNDKPWLKSYPAGVRWDAPIDIASVPSVLETAAQRFGALPALQFMDKRITYSELEGLANRAAAGLQKLGVGPGVRVGLYLPNTPHYVIAFFGVLKAGGVVVNYSPLDALRTLERKIEDSETDFLVTLDVASLYPQAEKLLASTRL